MAKTYIDIISDIDTFIDDDNVKSELLTLISANRNYLSQDDYRDIYFVMIKNSFSDNAKLSAIKAICDN